MSLSARGRLLLLFGGVVAAAAACGPAQTSAAGHPAASAVPSSPAAPSSSPSPRPVIAPHRAAPRPQPQPLVQEGDSGPAVLALQRRLIQLGYWLGTADGSFGDATQQAVFALQKLAGLSADGVVGPKTWRAVDEGVTPHPRMAPGHVVQVDLTHDVVMITNNGVLQFALNASTGGGYTYTSQGQTYLAVTPTGHFTTSWEVDRWWKSPLGLMWRPKFFNGGIALHGDTYVPSVPVSHGCVRVSIEAMNYIWDNNVVPTPGTAVWVYN